MTEPHDSSDAIKPILVVLVWRGGERFQRALDSIGEAEKFFSRIVISITSELTSDDLTIADDYVKRMNSATEASRAEIICTGRELPTMQHQAFWISYLLNTGARLSDWIYWLAYDDQVSVEGIKQILTKRAIGRSRQELPTSGLGWCATNLLTNSGEKLNPERMKSGHALILRRPCQLNPLTGCINSSQNLPICK